MPTVPGVLPLPCAVCGTPTTSKYGICQQTKDCRRERARRQNNVPPPSLTSCTECGGPLRADSTAGICTRNPECRRAGARLWKRENPEWVAAFAAGGYWADRRRSGYGRRYEALNNARTRAKRKGVPCTITIDDVPPIPDTCPVLGIPLRINNTAAQGDSPSLDRIVPELGYVPGNVMWISNRANSIKNDATPTELRAVADFYENLHLRRAS